MPGRMLYLHAISPIHSGTGQAVDVIDLPIARETTTGWPVLPGSGTKGVLRDACREAGEDPSKIGVAFGPEINHASDHAGGIAFADARLLCFPVRALKGSFAWLTSPLALRRWERDHLAAQVPLAPTNVAPPPTSDEDRPPILLTEEAVATLALDNAVYLEDLDLTPDVSQAVAVAALAKEIVAAVFPGDATWQDFFAGRFGIVPDDIFTFLARTATEVSARVRIQDERKTVVDGGLWYEEAVPAETIFAAPLLPMPAGVRQMAELNGGDRAKGETELFRVVAAGLHRPIQLGGNASVGRGLAWARLVPPVTEEQGS